MPKHVGVFICVMYTVSRSAFVGKPVDVVMQCVKTVSVNYSISPVLML